MRYWIAWLLFLGLGGGLAAESIKVAAFTYPPIYQEGAENGIALDLVKEAFKTQGVDVSFDFLPVLRVVSDTVAGRYPVAVAGRAVFNPDPGTKRPIPVTFGPAIMYVAQVFWYDSKKFLRGIDFEALSDLRNQSITVLNGSGIYQFLTNKGLRLMPESEHNGSVNALGFGDADLWAIVDLTGLMYLNKVWGTRARDFRSTKTFNRGDVSLVSSQVADPHRRYLSLFQKGFEAIKSSGKYLEIMARYYGSREKINPSALADGVKISG